MADIFLSYAREDEPRARLLAAALASCGWSVWWDRRIPPGQVFSTYIQQQLDTARCIVVLWSKASLASSFVRDEASEGRNDGRLVPLLIEAVKPPLGFRELQTADLSDWHTGGPHDEFDRLVSAIDAIVPRSPGAPTAQPSPVSPTSQPAPVDPQSQTAPNIAGTRPLFNASAWNLADERFLGFIEIPAGAFTMGSDKAKDDQAFDDELPQHQVTLPAFFIGRYEVTVGQYKACVNDGGCTPGDRQALDGPDDLPVRYVSWHEALAYGKWLELKLKSWSGAPRTLADALAGRGDTRAWRVTLPSEAEWERAARGTDGRIYPWGREIDPTSANYDEAERGGPTPVGSFPGGASPDKLLDMSGNVWEWTRSLWGKDTETPLFKYPYDPADGREDLKASADVRRVVRGGAFGSSRRGVRAAYRYWLIPDFRNYNFGFRVVVSPFSSGL